MSDTMEIRDNYVVSRLVQHPICNMFPGVIVTVLLKFKGFISSC